MPEVPTAQLDSSVSGGRRIQTDAEHGVEVSVRRVGQRAHWLEIRVGLGYLAGLRVGAQGQDERLDVGRAQPVQSDPVKRLLLASISPSE